MFNYQHSAIIYLYCRCVNDTSNASEQYLKKGKIITLPTGTQLNFIAQSSIVQTSENIIVLSDVVEMKSETLKFYGDKFEYDSKSRTVTALGDSCFMEVLKEAA